VASNHSIPSGLLGLARELEATWPAKLAELRASGEPLNAYDNLISRTDAGALIPEEVSDAFLQTLDNQSAVLSTFTHIPVSRAQVRFPVLSALPVAYWVNGDTGLKQTTEAAWSNKYLNIEEIAVFVPIPDNVLDDVDVPIWSQVMPLCEQAAGRLLDSTVFFGTNAPSSFPANVVSAATSAGNTITRTANNAAAGGFAQDLEGVTFTFPMRGQWPTASGTAEAVLYDPTEFVVGVRKDITWKLFDQAAIFDNNGNLIFSLPQQDMVALRMTLRVGWQVANAINYDQQTEASRYPAGLLLKP
jgi:hypothetical protein